MSDLYTKLFGHQGNYRQARDAWREAAPKQSIMVTFYEDGCIEWAGHAEQPIVCAAVSALRYAWEHYVLEEGGQGGPMYESVLATVRELRRLYPADLRLAIQAQGVIR